MADSDVAIHLGRPDLLEVVAADALDPAVTAVSEELEELELELTALEAKADALELQVQEARNAGTESGRALTMLERIFAEKATDTREQLRAAIDAAHAAAAERVAAARVAAEVMLRDAEAGTVLPLAPSYRSAGSRHAPSDHPTPPGPQRPPHRRAPAAWPAPPPSPEPPAPPFARRAKAATFFDGDVDLEDDRSLDNGLPTDEAEGYDDAEDWGPDVAGTAGPPAMALARHAADTLGAASVPTADGVDRFAQFWVPASRSDAAPPPKGGIIDVVLPMIAVTIVLVVVLSWMG